VQSLPQLMPAGVLVTDPLPLRLTVSVYFGSAVNVAVTLLAALIVTEQAPVPVQAPLQLEKAYPIAGVAVNAIAVPLT
jgi:hypothetical protein